MYELILACGCNGVGKSTFTNLLNLDHGGLIPILDQDKIVADFGVTPIEAGKLIINQINNFIKRGTTFAFESTLTSNFDFKIINFAKNSKYVIDLNYIGVDNYDILCERVHFRYLLGGHNIPEEVIIRRYTRSLQNLPKAIELVDKTTVC
jgi:predicted ABC-type ATPase